MLIRNGQSSPRQTLNQPLHRNQRLDSSESTDTNNQSTDAKISDGAKVTPVLMTLLYYHCLVICNKCQHIGGSEFCCFVPTNCVSMFPCNFFLTILVYKRALTFLLRFVSIWLSFPFTWLYQFIMVSVVYTCIWLLSIDYYTMSCINY